MKNSAKIMLGGIAVLVVIAIYALAMQGDDRPTVSQQMVEQKAPYAMDDDHFQADEHDTHAPRTDVPAPNKDLQADELDTHAPKETPDPMGKTHQADELDTPAPQSQLNILPHDTKPVLDADLETTKDYRISCIEDKDSDSCNTVGRIYKQGLKVKRDYIKAAEFYEKSCSLNNGDACDNLGTFYKNGKGVNKDSEKAMGYYNKACNLEESMSCFSLAVLYDKGQGTEKDTEKAKEFYQKACDQDLKRGCDEYKRLTTDS